MREAGKKSKLFLFFHKEGSHFFSCMILHYIHYSIITDYTCRVRIFLSQLVGGQNFFFQYQCRDISCRTWNISQNCAFTVLFQSRSSRIPYFSHNHDVAHLTDRDLSKLTFAVKLTRDLGFLFLIFTSSKINRFFPLVLIQFVLKLLHISSCFCMKTYHSAQREYPPWLDMK